MARNRHIHPDQAARAKALAAARLKQAADLPDPGGNWRRRRAVEATRAALLAQAGRFAQLAERLAPDAFPDPF